MASAMRASALMVTMSDILMALLGGGALGARA
jgi:hypothetical protein